MPKKRDPITPEKIQAIKADIKSIGLTETIRKYRRLDGEAISITTKKTKGMIDIIQVCMTFDNSYSYSQFLEKAITDYCRKLCERNIV